VDLDRFKAVNDRYGHHVGDGLLRAVADRLLTSVRDEDTVARIGGDEFGILAQDCDSWGSAEVVAQRVVSVLAEPFTVEGLTLTIGASVGVTMFPVFGDDYDSVVARADAAMYEAKARGRGRFERCLVADA
jgi:diguanylate cyclase (GGDEF)-like protein